MATATKEKLQRARVLVDNIALGVKAGQIIETAPAVIKAHAGELDANPAAVAYALQDGGKVVAYTAPEAAAGTAPAAASGPTEGTATDGA